MGVYRTSGSLVSSSEPQAHRVSIQYRHDLGPSVVYWLASIQGYLHIKILNLFFSETIWPIFTKFCMQILGARKWKFINMMLATDRDCRYSPEPVDRLYLTFVYSSWDSRQSWIVLVLNHISLASFLWNKGKWNRYKR